MVKYNAYEHDIHMSENKFSKVICTSALLGVRRATNRCLSNNFSFMSSHTRARARARRNYCRQEEINTVSAIQLTILIGNKTFNEDVNGGSVS